MPFTFSHPAIVLPGYYLPQRWRSLTGLVAGSIVPDYEMFLRAEAKISYSHTWHSIFWFNLPLALVLAFLFHGIVRNPLINHLPLFLKQRLSKFKSFDWAIHFRQHTSVVIISILIGVLSHLFWDNFTHRYGIFLQWFPVLAEEFTVGAYQAPLYYLLQLGFSVLGGFVVLYAILRIPPQTPSKQSKQMLPYWSLIAAVTFFLAAIRYTTGLDFSYIPNTIVVLLSAGQMGLLIASFIIRSR